ncbi:TetR/AcrR family transcriptional regulator [Roseibium sp.]|uniref:TetR/AcrR family transcriptional regulator n=1 Tax=Roseibium sp. TaxID=1936156 RepID=UPI003A9711EF
MKVTREDAAENRRRVVKVAAEMFREHGYDGIGIAALMKAAGLTNGAFYKQFDSKEALVAEATATALSENADGWSEALSQAESDPRAAISRWYLSDEHLAHRDKGCAFAALASEIPRHSDAVRSVFDDGLGTIVDQVTEALPSPGEGETETGKGQGAGPDEAIRLVCQMVGALMLARAAGDPDLVNAILSANRS